MSRNGTLLAEPERPRRPASAQRGSPLSFQPTARERERHTGGTSMRKPETAARRGVWALARFLHRNQLPAEKEKNASTGCQFRLVAPKRRRPTAFRPLGKAFFSFSPASGTHGAQKRAKAHVPGLFPVHARFSFIVSGFPACARRGAGRPAHSGHDVSCPYNPSSLQPIESLLVAQAAIRSRWRSRRGSRPGGGPGAGVRPESSVRP